MSADLESEAMAVMKELCALEPRDAIRRVVGWWDESHAHFIGGFMFFARLEHEGKHFEGPLSDFLANALRKGSDLSEREFPRLEVEAAIQAATATPTPDALFAVFSLFTREELQSIGF